MVRELLSRSGLAGEASRRIVLTGGASQLTGVAETARRMLGGNVRLGRPLGVTGMPEAAKSPAFSAAIGLVAYTDVAQIEQFRVRRSSSFLSMTGTDNYFARVGRWIKDSF